jgi:hypothetical protein
MAGCLPARTCWVKILRWPGKMRFPLEPAGACLKGVFHPYLCELSFPRQALFP